MAKIKVLLLLVSIVTVAVISSLVFANILIIKKTDFKYEYGIRIDVDGQIIENYVFVDIPIGIAIWSSNNTVANCTFINCSDEGIILLGSNNIIANCVFYLCCDGVELQKSSNNSFINCKFLSNTHAGIDAIHHSNSDNQFSFCIFYDNPYACYFSKSENNHFENCTFLENIHDILERE